MTADRELTGAGALVTGASGGIGRFGDIEILQAQDTADAMAYIVTRPPRVAINEVLIRPTEEW